MVYYYTISKDGIAKMKKNLVKLQYLVASMMIPTRDFRSPCSSSSAVGLTDSGVALITGIYVEEYAFAIKIINAVKAMDVMALADLTNFPVFLDNGTIHNAVNTVSMVAGSTLLMPIMPKMPSSSTSKVILGVPLPPSTKPDFGVLACTIFPFPM